VPRRRRPDLKVWPYGIWVEEGGGPEDLAPTD